MTESKNLKLLQKAKAENLEVQIFVEDYNGYEMELLSQVFVKRFEDKNSFVAFCSFVPEFEWDNILGISDITRVCLTGHTRESRQRERAQRNADEDERQRCLDKCEKEGLL